MKRTLLVAAMECVNRTGKTPTERSVKYHRDKYTSRVIKADFYRLKLTGDAENTTFFADGKQLHLSRTPVSHKKEYVDVAGVSTYKMSYRTVGNA